ncbi:glycyl-radical enzyme activating protein [Clostridiales bacterium COT073_COT-073]|nr:glycyl-radical enzyme activating protein [Clostridiales bacterium COT073_COT-073]
MRTCNVFNIERFATEDGHGIRTVIFLKGCHLKCKWCANPESQKQQSEILLKVNACISCGRCQTICREKAIFFDSEYGYITDSKKCTLCMDCVEGCYRNAREVIGKKYDETELLNEILCDEKYFKMSGGGITFSGGEPMRYYKLIDSIANQMTARGYNTLVETCGYAPTKAFAAIKDSVDYIYYDFKQFDSRKHKELTGVGNEKILENLEWLCQNYKGFLAVRYPYIPGCNGDQDSIHNFFRYMTKLQNVQEIIFLPYHRLGITKYQGLGRKYEMGELPAIRKAELSFLKEEAKKYGLEIKIQ